MSLSVITQRCAEPRACFSKFALYNRISPAADKRSARPPNLNRTDGGGGDVNRPRAADDFAAIRARMEELRREREGVRASERDLQLDPLVRRARNERWSPGETTAGPERVRQSSSGTQPDRDRASWARSE